MGTTLVSAGIFTSHAGLVIFVPQDLILIVRDLIPCGQRQNSFIINLITGCFSFYYFF